VALRYRKPLLSGGRAVHSGQLDRRRLALVAARFDSAYDGERLAALEAAGRLLAAGGSTWRDLIDGVTSGQKADHRSDADNGETVSAQHRLTVHVLLEFGGSLLTAWETNFLGGLRAFSKLSAKQRGVLDGIRRKVGVAA